MNNLLFTTEWNKSTVNDSIIDYCKQNNINFGYGHYGSLLLENCKIKTEVKNNIIYVYSKWEV